MFHTFEALSAFGETPALLAEGRTTSYAELAASARRFAPRWPRKRGLVAIEMTPTVTTIAAYLGALQAGHAVMPLPAGEHAIGDKLVAKFRPAASWRRVNERFRMLHHGNAAEIHADLGLLLMTSGSTGQGRGVRLSMGAVAANAASIAEYLAIGPEDRAALVLPLHYSYGLSVLHSHLLQGASLWLSTGTILDPAFLPQLADVGATSLAGVPHHFRLLGTAHANQALPLRLTCLTVAGGAMPPAEVSQWAARMQGRNGRFVVMYGQTEATARIAYLPHALAAQAPEAIGRAIPGGCLSLRDDAGRHIHETGQEGELAYSGPNVMMGYAQDAADLCRGPEVGELATGDMAVLGSDGLYRITGRRARMSKIAGLRVGHDALEQALAASGTMAAIWGDDAQICVAARTPDAALRAEVARLAGIGAQHVVLVPCDTLPRHPNGKIDYPALKAMAVRPTDRDVLSAFTHTFAPTPVRQTDSFRSLGGDSLQHVELSLVLDQQLGGLPTGWEGQTIKELEAVAPSRSGRVAMPLLARALAILAVVTAHQTHWPVYGGAAAMVILLGMSVAEHRSRFLATAETLAFLAPLTRILVPYFIVAAGYAAAWTQVPWASVALVGNFAVTTPETHLMLPYLYWFVEAYVQICLLLIVLFRPRWMRRWLSASLFGTGLFLLAFGTLLRLSVPELWPLPAGRAQFTVPWVFYLFALGWCIAAAKSFGQRGFVLIAATMLLSLAAWLGGNWYGSWAKYLSLLGLTGLLLFVETVPMPRFAVRGVMHLAQGAFPIYLLHRLVPDVLMPPLAPLLPPAMFSVLAIVGGIALGLFAGRGLGVASRAIRALPEVWRVDRALTKSLWIHRAKATSR